MRLRGRWVAALVAVACLVGGIAPGRAADDSLPSQAPAATCLILPFENRSGDDSLDWIGESFVVALTEELRDAPVTIFNRKERQQALRLAGVPEGAAPSHATSMRMAEAADAHWLIVGWYSYDGEQLHAQATLIDLSREHAIPLAQQDADLPQLETLQGRLAWAARQQLDPDATAAPDIPALPLAAYESYVRAELSANPQTQLKDLAIAIHLAPRDARVIYALGEASLAAGNNAAALKWMLQVPAGSRDYAQAQFSAGLAAYRTRQYGEAVKLFSGLQAQYPLPSVTADLALAQARLASPDTPASGSLKTDFPADRYRQLAMAVTQFDQARLAALPEEQRSQFALSEGERLAKQGAWDAAARNFAAVTAAGSVATHAQLAEAHAGLAAIWMRRLDPKKAAEEVAAALAEDPNNTAAQAVQAQLAANGSGHHD